MDLCILGSTGSIGTQTLSVVRNHPGYRVVSLSAGKNLALLRSQIREFSPRLVCVQESQSISTLQSEFPDVEFVSGSEGLLNCVDHGGDIVVVGIVGFAALEPTLRAIRLNKKIALANKETLVVGGKLLREELQKSRAVCIPVDSEHSALFQLLEKQDRTQVESLVLTASGGPLLRRPELPLEQVTPEIAVAHPNWKMGPKISVDSATLMNKGLELIEAHFLFDFPASAIEIWVHPQSIVHGALWMRDHSCLAQLNKPDMRLSIAYALSYPKRLTDVIPKLAFADFAKLEFLEPDAVRFPALRLTREALTAGPSHLVALNAANEVAVARFLDRKISFPAICRVVEDVLESHPRSDVKTLDDIFEIDLHARALARESNAQF